MGRFTWISLTSFNFQKNFFIDIMKEMINSHIFNISRIFVELKKNVNFITINYQHYASD